MTQGGIKPENAGIKVICAVQRGMDQGVQVLSGRWTTYEGAESAFQPHTFNDHSQDMQPRVLSGKQSLLQNLGSFVKQQSLSMGV